MIDCLFIGYNDIETKKYYDFVRVLGSKSIGYRNLDMSLIKQDNTVYSILDIFNHAFKKTRSNVNVDLSDLLSSTITYLGSYLMRNNINFEYIMSFQKEKDNIRNLILNNEISCVAISTTLYTSALPIVEIIEFVKYLDKDIPVVVGGPHLLTQYQSKTKEALKRYLQMINADYYIISSKGEKALVELLNCIKSGNIIPEYICSKNNNYEYLSIIQEDSDINDCEVDWDYFKGRMKSCVSLRTAISCKFSCSFCSFPQLAGKYSNMNMTGISRQFKKINMISDIKSVSIVDDTFNIPTDRFKNILKLKKQYSFKWNSYIRCQFLDEEAVFLMKESGCEGVFLGIESASQEILNNMNKRTLINEYVRGIELLKKYEIPIFTSFICGFPGETQSTFQDTLDFIKTYKPDFYRIHLWFCDHNTSIWKERDKYDLSGIDFEWKHNSMDSLQAQQLIESNFNYISESSWLTQYNFDFVNLFTLLRKGLTMNQLKSCLNSYNNNIRNRLANISNEKNIIDEFVNIIQKEQVDKYDSSNNCNTDSDNS